MRIHNTTSYACVWVASFPTPKCQICSQLKMSQNISKEWQLNWLFSKPAFYTVHPSLWTRVTTWWFSTFLAPAIKHKIHNIHEVTLSITKHKNKIHEVTMRIIMKITKHKTQHTRVTLRINNHKTKHNEVTLSITKLKTQHNEVTSSITKLPTWFLIELEIFFQVKELDSVINSTEFDIPMFIQVHFLPYILTSKI